MVDAMRTWPGSSLGVWISCWGKWSQQICSSLSKMVSAMHHGTGTPKFVGTYASMKLIAKSSSSRDASEE